MRNQRGFTLVEMLVSLMAASLLIGLCYGSILLGQRSAHLVWKKASADERLMSGWKFLQNAVRMAYVPSVPDANGDRTHFHGRIDHISFLSNLPQGAGIGGISQIRLFLRETDTGTKEIVLEKVPYGIVTDTPPALIQAVLLENAESLEISYQSRDHDGDESEWREEWTDPDHLPALVRIQIKPADAPAWPLLLVAPLELEPLRRKP